MKKIFKILIIIVCIVAILLAVIFWALPHFAGVEGRKAYCSISSSLGLCPSTYCEHGCVGGGSDTAGCAGGCISKGCQSYEVFNCPSGCIVFENSFGKKVCSDESNKASSEAAEKRDTKLREIAREAGVGEVSDNLVASLADGDFSAITDLIGPEGTIELAFINYDGKTISSDQFSKAVANNTLSKIVIYKKASGFQIDASQLLEEMSKSLGKSGEPRIFLDDSLAVDENKAASDYQEAAAIYNNGYKSTTLYFTKDHGTGEWFLTKISYSDREFPGY
ncbi:hypothetical protein ACFL0Z_02600 [Patescibacteria group bacterium]